MLTPNEIHELYMKTEVVRRPTYGIVSGYHTLPYVCLGTAIEGEGTTRVSGKIHVSPRLLLRPQHLEPSYSEIFGDENVDTEIGARVFGFLGFKGKPVDCKSEHIEVQTVSTHMDRVLEEVLDQMARMEDITTGVIITPDSRYFPVSVERFIASVIEDEFSV